MKPGSITVRVTLSSNPMIARILPFLLALILAGPVTALTPDDLGYGPRPPLAVFDPDGFLKPELVKEISDPLTTLYKNEGVDVLVVVLKDLQGAPPEHVAKCFAKAWCSSPVHCVVLHVPGRTDSPWIFPAGKLIELLDPLMIRQTVDAAENRAASETKESEKVRAAATEASDMLRYWMNNVVNHSELLQTERDKMYSRLEHESRFRRAALLLGVACLIPLVAGVSLICFFFRKRGPRYFPNRAWQLRLGAPHAGGNHAVAKLDPPTP
ncbi:MAG: hypothetical protein ABI600_20995 [Luteolibacter sp.]